MSTEQPSRGMMRFAAALLLARYRSQHLLSRATCVVPITLKTGRRQIHTCIVCGERVLVNGELVEAALKIRKT